MRGDDSIEARTKDGQQVCIDASVIYALDPAHVIDMHITWQNRFEDNVVRPVARAAIREAVSQYGVEEIVTTKRMDLENDITRAIAESFKANNLILSDFLLRNIAFSDEYAKAVEQKQIAEQQALQAILVVEQRKQEAEQARQVAQGQADAAVIAAKGAADARLLQAEAEAQANQLLAQSLYAAAAAVSVHPQACARRPDDIRSQRQSIHPAAAECDRAVVRCRAAGCVHFAGSEGAYERESHQRPRDSLDESRGLRGLSLQAQRGNAGAGSAPRAGRLQRVRLPGSAGRTLGPDDAAVWRLDEERALVVTTDFFTPIVDDAYAYGAIAAANSLSDVYAMGGKPFLALNIAALPEDLPASMVSEILRGGAEKAREAGVVIAGGHTVKDREPKYGLVVLGFVDPAEDAEQGRPESRGCAGPDQAAGLRA